MTTVERIRQRLEVNEIPASPELAEKLDCWLRLLDSWNSRMDLTAVLEPEEMIDRHLIDSLTVLKTDLLEGAHTLIDVGTGAGFPGMALALACPEMRVTLLDSQQKRLDFLDAVCAETGARNVTLAHDRAEDAGRKKEMREQYDRAVARAVAPLSVLCEYLLPFVKTDGRMLCWKGPALKDELEAGRRAAHVLGGRLEMPVSCPVAGWDWDHRILPVRKTQPTPRPYPRKAGVPKKTPLG